VIEMRQLKQDLPAALATIYQYIDMPMAASFADSVTDKADASSSHSSQHRYALADYGLSSADVDRLFSEVWPVQNNQS
jgi:hypothetical protein